MGNGSKLMAGLRACAKLLWIRIKIEFVRDHAKQKKLVADSANVVRELTACLNR